MGRALFPLVIRLGQSKATLYETPIRGAMNYTLCWYEGTSRRRQVFANLDEAKREGQIRVNGLARGEAEILRLSGVERLEFLRARELLKEFSKSFDSIAAEYRDAKRLLKGGSLVAAAEQFAATHLLDAPKRTVPELVQEMLQAKRDEGLSDYYLKDLSTRLADFTKAFPCDITSVTGPLVRNWLQEKNVGNRTRNNFRIAVRTLFSFAKTRKYLPGNWNELDQVPVWKNVSEEIEIFTPEEMTDWLNFADPRLLPYLTIGGFAGLRTAEIERLDWSDIDLEAGYIRVSASKSKTGSRRLVPIANNLRVWLERLARKEGPVIVFENLARAVHRMIESRSATSGNTESGKPGTGVQWKHNALRHSYCSYRLAVVKNAAQVALEAGNSPKMIFEHYRELVTEAQATRWFEILPS